MQLNASLSKTDIRLLLEQMLPLKIDLDGKDGNRLLVFDRLEALSLVAERGIRVELSGEVIWPVLGLDVPVRIKSLSALIGLSRETRPQANLLVGVELEDADLAWVPGVVDQGITERINKELRERQSGLAWNFEKLLSHSFGLPDALRSAESISLAVASSSFHVAAEQITLGVALQATVLARLAP